MLMFSIFGYINAFLNFVFHKIVLVFWVFVDCITVFSMSLNRSSSVSTNIIISILHYKIKKFNLIF